MRGIAIAVVLLTSTSCEVSDDDPEEGSTGEATTAASTSTSTSSGSTSSSETAPAETGPMGPGTCRRECTLPADCCGAVDPCPTQDYPGNVECSGNLCEPAACANAQECEAAIPGSSCEMVGGFPQCVVLCDDDGPCGALGADYTCGSPTDGGARYCNRLCTTGAVVCSAGTCDETSGLCLCEDDSGCVNGFRCV